MYFLLGAFPSHAAHVRGAILAYSPEGIELGIGFEPHKNRVAGISLENFAIFMCVYGLWFTILTDILALCRAIRIALQMAFARGMVMRISSRLWRLEFLTSNAMRSWISVRSVFI
jgi:hypothetical protein